MEQADADECRSGGDSGRAGDSAASPILRIGLTGSIGAGKSTVAGMLAELGCLIVDADRLGHEVLNGDPEVRTLLAEQLGDDVLDADGIPDRRAIAAVVFSDAGKREALNRILHPRIRARERELIDDWGRRGGFGITITEAALLVETGGYRRYQGLIVVVAPTSLRLGRLVDRGLDRDEAARRDAAQAPQEAKISVADYVVDNGGTRDETRRQVGRLHEALTADLTRLRAGGELGPRGLARRFDRNSDDDRSGA